MTVSLVSGVEKYAAPRQNTVGVRDERRGPLHVMVAVEWPVGAFNAVVDVRANGIIPVAIVGGVDGKLRRILGNAEPGNPESKHVCSAIESKHDIYIDTLARHVDHSLNLWAKFEAKKHSTCYNF
jgi:hypothetical protein